MATTVSCPVEGFTHISITYPDKWAYRHKLLFLRGVAQADREASWFEGTLLGCIALCEKVEGLELEEIGELPMHYAPFFEWVVVEIYPKYSKAAEPPDPNPSAQQPITPKE